VVPTRLFEFESKFLLRGYGIAVPNGVVLEKPTPPASLASLSFPRILKAQVPVGGRGKAGGISKVNSPEEARRELDRIFLLTIGGFPVSSVLAEEVVATGRELYLSMLVDRSGRCHTLIAGSRGGIDIEETSKDDPLSILRVGIQPLEGLSDPALQAVASHLGFGADALSPLLRAVYGCFVEEDAELLEINPLVTTERGLVALDAKIIIDDNALFRHPWVQQLPPRGKSPEELEAEKAGLNYVSMDGNIGIIGNGAGLTMATTDLVNGKGGKAANFLDLGAGAKSGRVAEAILFLSRQPRIKGIFVNIFGGMTRCDEVAMGIAAALPMRVRSTPVVVRLIGTNQAQGKEILASVGIGALDDPQMAAEMIVSLVADQP
jgi:succinyl-CoA synthetase beta subunit